MPIFLTGEELKAHPHPLPSEGEVFCRMGLSDLVSLGPVLQIPQRVIAECGQDTPSKLESHDGFDYISLHVPDFHDLLSPCRRIFIYFRQGLLVFAGESDPLMDGLLPKEDWRAKPLQTLLLTCFDRLTGDDFAALESLEEEIGDLEEALMTKKRDNCVREIIGLRRRLMVLKRYYEQLSSLLEEMEENLNGLLDDKALRFVHILSGRAGRLCANVNNLRDYVTQVREAYQAQVDISLNSLMKLFTVVTTIFLPLSLIAGWYGMNFDMPEYHWAWGYPAVILLGAAVVILCILLFRKKKWL